MPTPQPGIFAQGTRAHHHLELALRAGADPDAVLDALRSLRQPNVTVGGANIVVAFAPELWRRIGAACAPDALAPFPDIPGVPAEQGDVWVWAHGTGGDVMLDVARTVARLAAPVADVVYEQAGFVYHDSRDLTGFVDGTENPSIDEAFDVAVVADGAGAGGCFAMTQRWVHDLAAFEALPVDDQERVIGRTKAGSVELDDGAKPPTAHIARVVVERDGEELELWRRSVPYGNVGEHGLQFVAFSADPSRFEIMLRRMFGLGGDGVRDRLTDFSRPVRGGYWFAPSLEDLGSILG